MEQIGMFGLGIVQLAIIVFLLLAAILGFLIPFFVYRIRNEVIITNNVLDEMQNELEAVNDHLILLVKAAHNGELPPDAPKM